MASATLQYFRFNLFGFRHRNRSYYLNSKFLKVGNPVECDSGRGASVRIRELLPRKSFLFRIWRLMRSMASPRFSRLGLTSSES